MLCGRESCEIGDNGSWKQQDVANVCVARCQTGFIRSSVAVTGSLFRNAFCQMFVSDRIRSFDHRVFLDLTSYLQQSLYNP